jgi:PAT family beta-lactamase induction signal transducer AmpG
MPAGIAVMSAHREPLPSKDPAPVTPPARKGSFWDAFRSPRLALMLGLGFASGLPNPLTGSTLTAWLASERVSLDMIGFAALFALPYNVKFLWAPLLDRFAPPGLGRRRGWMLITQLALIVSLGVMGSFDPGSGLTWIGVMAVITAFLSATQDVASDAYRTDVLPPEQRASGTAIFVAAYRGALIVAGAVALSLSDVLPWSAVYWILAGLLGLGVITTLIAPAPASDALAPKSMKEAVLDPLRDLFRRRGVWIAILIILFYKVGDTVAGHFQIPFLMEVGFSRTEIGAVLKGLGLGATIVGALLGGGFVARWGLRWALIVFGVAQAVANLGYVGVALVGKDYAWMMGSIVVDNFMNGLGTAAFVAFLMMLCNKRFTAVQYAFFSSLMTVPGRLFGYGAGLLTAELGWPTLFGLSVVVAAPALILLARVDLRALEAK